MKWTLLIAILFVAVIAFGLWRRTHGTPEPTDQDRPSRMPAAPEPRSSVKPETIPPAAEEGVDEVSGAPATEARPADPSRPDHQDAAADDWWPDSRA